MDSIGARIRRLRIAAGLTLEDTGRAVGVSRQAVQRYESGIVKEISRERVLRLAALLNTTPEYLYGDTEDPYDKAKTAIGGRIRKRRNELGLTQTQLAEKVGYSDKSMIAKIERGKVDLGRTRILQFAEALSTTPAYLMGWTEDPYDRAKTAEDFAKEMIGATPTLMAACDMAIKAKDILIGLFWERSKDNEQG